MSPGSKSRAMPGGFSSNTLSPNSFKQPVQGLELPKRDKEKVKYSRAGTGTTTSRSKASKAGTHTGSTKFEKLLYE